MTGVSWKPGCPVPLEDLRAIRMRFWGFDARAHKGVLIVNADVAGDVVTTAFAAEGFGWGGDYTSLKDYQHFERAP
jgi:D-alanyl-D-alanine carboxypeptidase